MWGHQREHTANIIDAPKVYPRQDVPKQVKLLTMDCRGLEFVEFKPDVSFSSSFLPFEAGLGGRLCGFEQGEADT